MQKFPRKIKFETIKALLSRTGNQCAFPGCVHPIFNDSNLLVAQLCHIEAVSPDGPRYNPDTTTEQVNSYDNLVFLCYRHHRETDNQKAFDKGFLTKIKYEHEIKFKESGFKISDTVLTEVLTEINDYWDSVDNINKNEHTAFDFKIVIDTTADELKLIDEVRQIVKKLDWLISILPKNLEVDYFEIVCLGFPNNISRLTVLLEQLEIKILELKLVNEPKSAALRSELERLRTEFKKTAKNAGLLD